MDEANEVKQANETDEVETASGVGIVRARDILGDLVARASYGNERIVITKHGKDAAALIGMRDFGKLRASDDTE